MARRAEIEQALRALAPRLPGFETGVVVDSALDSFGLARARASEAAWLALVSYVRHALTDYDALLDEGYDVDSARFFVRDAMVEILAGWGVRRRLAEDGDADGRPVDPAGPPL